MTSTEIKPRSPDSAPAVPEDIGAPVRLQVRQIAPSSSELRLPDDGIEEHPLARISKLTRRKILAITFIIAPMIVASVYYLLLLSDQYISETRFVIRSMSSTGLSGIAIMTQGQGLARTEDDTNLVNEFLQSRDAIKRLAEKDKLLQALAHPQGDVFYGFPTVLSGSSREDLYQHYSSFIDVSYQASTGITTLQVRAFTPEDAQRLAKALLTHAEDVVNALNRRARVDAVRFSETVATAAEKRVIEAQKRLAVFRNREGVLDPERQSVATLELINKLFAEKLALETTLTATQTATPNNPKIPAILNRLTAIEKEIAALQGGLTGGKASMASKLAEFERLNLERELAAKSLTAALSTLERARQDAVRQQLYLERVVEPNLADKSQYPKRFQSLAVVFVICIALYWIAKSFSVTILEHDA